MSANIRNYTSAVPVSRTISMIEERLAEFGATDILKTYNPETKRLTALKFILVMHGRKVPILLPAKVDECAKEMLMAIRRPRSGTIEKVQDQAERTAWKLAFEWLDIQLVMVQLKQKDLLEVFLADVWNPATEQTHYEQLRTTQFKALLPPAP